MKRWGKEEAVPAASPNKRCKRTLLQTYLVSLVSLCLSVTMLLGTTMAWFTSSVDVPENEIYVGTLDVDLLFGGDSLKVDTLTESEPRKVFDSKDIIWSPDHVEVRSLTVMDRGEIPFTYRLTLTPGVNEDGTPKDEGPVGWDTDLDEEQKLALLSDFRRQFDVYVKEEATEEKTISSQELLDMTEWTRIGNLQEIYENELSVFAGESEKMEETEVEGKKLGSATYSIAIHMSPEYVPAPADPEAQTEPAAEGEEEPTLDMFQGYTLNFTIKLVASQTGTPEQVKDEAALIAALNSGRSAALLENVELTQDVALNHTMLNGNDKKLYLSKDGGDDYSIVTTGGTVRNLTIIGAGYNEGKAIASGDSESTIQVQNLYIDHVVIDNVQYALYGKGDGKCKVVVTNSEIHGGIRYDNVTGVDFVNCIIADSQSAYASMEVCGTTSFSGCTFGEFALSMKDNLPENCTLTFTDCTFQTAEDQTEAVTAQNVMKLFAKFLSAEGAKIPETCTIIVDGVQVYPTSTNN